MSTISASTASNTAFKVTSDTTGTLVFQTGAVPTTAISIDASQVVSIGNIAVTGATTFAAGSAAAPSITTTGDTNTGIFFPAADTIGFTEGGVEAMRINSSGNVGIGTASPLAKLQIQTQTNGNAGFVNSTSVAGGVKINCYNDAGNSSSPFELDASTLQFNIAAVEKMRLDTSGNLGIGTTSAGSRLTVSNSSGGNVASFTNTTDANLNINLTSGVTLLTPSTGTLAFGTSSTERMRLDSSGNLGLGVTPSAWYTTGGTSKWIEMPSGVSFGDYGGSTTVGNNWFANSAGTDIYKITGYAVQYVQTSGTHVWKIAGVGNSGDTISFTQAMTLTAAGRLGVGQTSPGVAFSVAGQSEAWQIGFTTASGTAGGLIGSPAADVIAFGNWAGTERARIDSSGNLLVGTTSNIVNNNARLAVVGTEGIRAQATSSGGTAAIAGFGTSTGATYYFVGYDLTASAIKFQVLFNGNVQNTNNSYGAISDVKLKENIVDASPKLNDLMQVKVRNYNLKTEPTHKQIGVIAQELETIFPSMVEEALDYDLEGNNLGTTTKAVKYSVFVPMLIKAIQEQQVMINELMAKFAALESK